MKEVTETSLSYQHSFMIVQIQNLFLQKRKHTSVLMSFFELAMSLRMMSITLSTLLKASLLKGGMGSPPSTIEGKIVQDADRLDAIGAIGIARAFTYGGAKGHVLFKEDEIPRTVMTEDEYHQNPSSVIGHFYEKLLLLKEKMNTKKAIELATDRHRFMMEFLEKFKEEWNGTNEDVNS
jgi:uncharacterized protein